MSTTCSYTVEPENIGNSEDKAVIVTDGVLTAVLRRLSQFWPVSFVMRSVRGLWWLLGFSPPEKGLPESESESRSVRQCRAGKKRLRRVTRLVLAFLPRRLQSALGFPVCTSIGCTVSPEVRCSPTKPSGKGSKRKQDDVEDDDDDEEDAHPSWVEALTQELVDEDCQVDPDYEPSSVEETDSEEYRSHDTESDTEVQEGKGPVEIQDVIMDVPAEA
ncbi:hypothetical protein AAFF_G00005610 [Aldrovandia affinis]|uniref:Oogenesis-related gene n=1 Tax=Aldrovandia affinis TaxID=143900 RepID=A0AAD7TEK2_9TELE|nr:hypothetical protein AAFF_G00005610 [Aldrovandia affinis]